MIPRDDLLILPTFISTSGISQAFRSLSKQLDLSSETSESIYNIVNASLHIYDIRYQTDCSRLVFLRFLVKYRGRKIGRHRVKSISSKINESIKGDLRNKDKINLGIVPTS